MGRAKYYSPPLDRDLVSSLYHLAKSRQMPMTRLVSALVREGLTRLEVNEANACVREDPPAPDPAGGTQ